MSTPSGILARLLERHNFEPDTLLALQSAPQATVPAGSFIFHPGDACTSFLLVLSGRVRVTRLTEAGRELVLFRIEAGQSCVLTTACLLAGEDHAAEAFAETDVSALAIQASLFRDLLERSAAFRSFVFQTFGSRLLHLTELLENLAFDRIDVRLAKLLLARSAKDSHLQTTHQELANELGTAREVVSRHLELLASAGLVELGRGHLKILKRSALSGFPRP